MGDAFADRTKLEFVEKTLRPIGLFGFLVTLGLFIYEINGIAKCNRLIETGKKLEADLCTQHGQFLTRPAGMKRLMNKQLAAAFIYPAVLAAWAFIAHDIIPSR